MIKKNKDKESFLDSIPTASLDIDQDTLASRCKFNFSYFDNSQPAGQDFNEWSHEKLHKLLNKLVNYSKETLTHWTRQKVGKSGTVLAIYNGFPSKSDFSLPKSIPHQARWARFRLEHDCRLVGFVIPEEYDKMIHKKTGYIFCSNTFYVVFLDQHHKFYKS
jgi:hypothetical protein